MGKKDETEKNESKVKPMLVLGEEWFEENGLPWSGKRGTVVSIYYSFPGNQNASGSTGTNVISQKLIPWGDDAEPRVYISPFALKRRIRDYWIKKGENVGFKEDYARGIVDIKNEEITNYIDYDLFGFMSGKKEKKEEEKETKKKEKLRARPGPITSWGAVSLETYRSFIDFNSSLRPTSGESEEGGSLFNRAISKEFYFTSFYINPDLIGVDPTSELEGKDKQALLELKKKRLGLFFEGLKYAMQKDTGGPRDKPACVFMGVSIGEYAYPIDDKLIFRSIKISNDKIVEIGVPENMDVLHFEKSFFGSNVSVPEVKESEKVIKKLLER